MMEISTITAAHRKLLCENLPLEKRALAQRITMNLCWWMLSQNNNKSIKRKGWTTMNSNVLARIVNKKKKRMFSWTNQKLSFKKVILKTWTWARITLGIQRSDRLLQSDLESKNISKFVSLPPNVIAFIRNPQVNLLLYATLHQIVVKVFTFFPVYELTSDRIQIIGLTDANTQDAWLNSLKVVPQYNISGMYFS